MKATLVVLTKLPGLLPVKTRLWPWLGPARAEGLYRWMLFETVSRLHRLGTPVVAFSPPDANPVETMPWLEHCELLPTPGRDGAECLEYAIGAAHRGDPLVVVGGDTPDLPLAWIGDAVRALVVADVALVPSLDGGFSCLALREPLPGLARRVRFGDAGALDALRRFVADERRSSVLLPPWPDVDTRADVLALLRRRQLRSPHRAGAG